MLVVFCTWNLGIVFRRCYFCKMYVSCNYSELGVRLLAFMHLAKDHAEDRAVKDYYEKEK